MYLYGPMASETEPDDAREPRVAEVLAQVRSGVLQRRAELATIGGSETRLKLLELKSKEFVEEPIAVSPRPGIGPLLVFMRKAFFHLGFKWYARPVLQQQNGFNQAVGAMVQDLGREQEKLAQAIESLARRLAELERRLGAPSE